MDGEYGLEIEVANEKGLKRHLGVTEAEALKLVEYRRAGNALNAAGIEATLGAARAAEVKATLEAATPLDATELSRQVRHKVKEWAEKTPLSEALLYSLLPRPRAEGTTTVVSESRAEGEGFARVRRGVSGEFVPSSVSYETVSRVFEGVRGGAIARLAERLADLSPAEREAASKTTRNLRLEIVETNDILATHKDGVLRLSSGLLNEINARANASSVPPAERGAMRMRILSLIMGHEAAHAGGIVAERVADAEGLRIYEKTGMAAAAPVDGTVIRETLKVFDRPLGSSHVDNFLNRMRSLLRYGTTRGRIEALERAARGEVDALANYRRADGTLEWKRLSRDRVLKEANGLAHFGMALFLKEIATVAATGDRARIEEFFDGLLTTDFYKHYGLFVAGARVGEVAYVRYLQRFVKPKFVNGVLKTNLVLAAGLALPMIVDGTFTGKAFAISLGSLGLSSAAVKTGVAGIKWVMNLKKAKKAGVLRTVGVGAGRLAKAGGWFYHAAELAVVLYFAEKIEHRVHDFLDLRAARSEIADAGEALIKKVNAPDATRESASEATLVYGDAWVKYRNFLYRKLEMEEDMFAMRLEKVARSAKIAADERKAAMERIERYAALRGSIVRRYGSLEGYSEHLVREDEAEIREDVSMYMDSYKMNRDKLLEEVYRGNRRDHPLLGGVAHKDWLFAGGHEGAAGDPAGSGSYASVRRSRARSGLRSALEEASENRLEAYDDEAEVLAALVASLKARDRADLAAPLTDAAARNRRLHAADSALINGDGMIDDVKVGATERVEETTSAR
jgi:hypothetical protein